MFRVKDLIGAMARPVASIDGGATVNAAARQMVRRKVGSLVVIDQRERPVGMFTEGDAVRRVLAEERDPSKVTVAEVMSQPLWFADTEDTIAQCHALMQEHKVRRLPVLQCGTLISLIRVRDLQGIELADQAQIIHQLEEYMHGYYR